MKITLSGVRGSVLAFFLTVSAAGYSQYCVPNESDCSDGDQIQNVTFAGIDNDSGCDDVLGYSDFTAGTAGSVVSGSTYTLSVTVGAGGDEVVGAYFDFNQNEIFEETEFFYVGTIPTGTLTASITIPESALEGATRMRIRTFYNIWGDTPETLYLDFGDGSCIDVTGLDEFGSPAYSETEDYTINVVAGTPCDGTPEISAATSTETSVCGTATFTVSASVSGTSIGFSYQLQSSIDGGTTWNDLGTAQPTGTFEVTGQAVATSYRVVVTCVASTETATSDVIAVGQNPFSECYCTPGDENPLNCEDGDIITNMTFGAVNNDSTCGTNGYTNYAETFEPIELAAGETYPISVTVGPSGDGWEFESVGVWIDYNQDGLFTEDEFTDVGTGLDETLTNNIVIPDTALDGITSMRVITSATTDEAFDFTYACSPLNPDNNFGEVEDYRVNITNDLSAGDFGKGIVGIFPNPAQDVLNIQVKDGVRLNSVEVYNIAGQKVMHQDFDGATESSINVQALSAGVYVVKLATDNGTSSQRLIKK